MLPSITYLDLETTGATPTKDRITEIALVRFENGIETARWETLVNPEQPISPFIQNLTGIDDAMVADAPVFSEVAEKLHAFLQGTVLSAHNVRFDYGFIKAEFKRLGMHFKQKVLCTVKLSRLLYPQHYSHGLDAIIQRHAITTNARHRAMGDVESVLAYLQIAKDDLGAERLTNLAEQLLRGPTLPPHLNASYLEDMPESPGVYELIGEDDFSLYIGKGNNIRDQVLKHFSSDQPASKASKIAKAVRHIVWHDTAGEFGALLLETALIKEKQPLHNRKVSKGKTYFSWQLSEDDTDKPLCTLRTHDEFDSDLFAQYFGLFNTKRHATQMLRKVVNMHRLCAKLIGLEESEGPCFGSEKKQCKGVCIENEVPEVHYLRLKHALLKHQIKPWPYAGKVAIKEQNAENGLTQLHVFLNWQYLGCIENEDALYALADTKQAYVFDVDHYKLLLKRLSHRKTQLLHLD